MEYYLQHSYDRAKAIKIIETPIDPKLIKVREEESWSNGKKTKKQFKYISQATVINILNSAFGYEWSFETPHAFVQEAQPTKEMTWSDREKKYVPVLDENGKPKLKEEPGYVVVCGRLTVPGLGVKEQWGSCVLLGGASVQQDAFKAAASDALKKCATLFGIAIELYDDAPEEDADTWTPKNIQKYSEARAKLSELKTKFGIGPNENTKLNPMVRSFLGRENATWENILPSNIENFVAYLEKQLP